MNLAIGILGLIAVDRRDSFQEATIIAATVFGVGASIAHFMDVIAAANLAPGITLQKIANLLKPTPLIGFLLASRRDERLPGSETTSPEFAVWRRPRILSAGLMTASLASGFEIGFAMNLIVIGTLFGGIVGGLLVVSMLYKSAHVLQR